MQDNAKRVRDLLALAKKIKTPEDARKWQPGMNPSSLRSSANRNSDKEKSRGSWFHGVLNYLFIAVIIYGCCLFVLESVTMPIELSVVLFALASLLIGYLTARTEQKFRKVKIVAIAALSALLYIGVFGLAYMLGGNL